MDLFDGPLTQEFDAGIQANLDGILTTITLTGPALDAMRAGASRAETALTSAFQSVGRAATGAEAAITSAASGVNRFGHQAAEGVRGLTEMARHVDHFAEGVTRLAAEQQRLDRINRETGLNLERIAASSERYMSQLDAAKVVEQFAAARMNLSQVQAEALAQGAARLAQMFDTSVEEQGRRLFSAISRGEIEVLATLGPHMAALSGQSHTATERLTAFIDHLGELGPATEDAATHLERMKGSVEAMERSFSSGFVDEAQRLFTGVGQADEDMTHLSAGMRELGRDAANLIGAIANLALVPVLAIGTLISALSDEMGRVINIAERLAHGDLAGARAARNSGSSQDTQDLFETMMGRLRAGGAAAAHLFGVDTGEDPEAPEARHDGSAAAGAMLFGPGTQPDGRRTTGRGGRGHRRPTLDQLMGRAFQDEDAARRVNRRFGLHVELPEFDVPDQWGERRSIRDMEQDSAGKEAERARREQEQFEQGEAGKSAATRERVEQDRRNGVGARLAAAFEDPDNTPEARAARAIGTAWTNATEALGAHLGLVVSGQETWSQFWDALGTMALKTLSEMAATEGKLEFGRALAALAAGNVPGFALHTAAGIALTGLGAALGAAASPAPSASAGGGGRSVAPPLQRVPDLSAKSAPSTATVINVNYGGASFYGAGGKREAAADLLGLINTGGPLSGAVLDPRLVRS